jgi:N-acetyl-gamma-glutamyl-phosphate reductase
MANIRKVRVGLVGESGRSGAQARELLLRHPLAELVYSATSRTSQGKIDGADVIFLATPNDVSFTMVPQLLGMGKRVVDFSRAYRVSGEAVYGLPEKNRDMIRDARLVSNPGCYATGIILAILPIAHGVRSAKVVSVSGISGAGKHPAADGGLMAYKPGWEHDHLKEMVQELGLSAMLFTPVVCECLDRGIVSTIYVELDRRMDIREELEGRYDDEGFVHVKSAVDSKMLLGTNLCDISVSQRGRDAVITSALDNLMKGAAGQAVQNMNIMFGIDEKAGLENRQSL